MCTWDGASPQNRDHTCFPFFFVFCHYFLLCQGTIFRLHPPMYIFLWVHNIVLQIHRDLKSDNVLLDEHWVAKVADFGSSRKLRNNRPTEIVSAFTGTRQVARTSDATMIAELSNPTGWQIR
eukprot:m.406376 g.406376  ORF g.406376 m.406376 type:complete len:122 (-) comp28435_c0_seq1:568-933(-)